MIFKYKDNIYPEYIKNGNAVKYIEPIAKEFCKGYGLDIGGYNDWTLKGAIPININDPCSKLTADDLGDYRALDYIFSSHCIEHLEEPKKTLKYWYSKLTHNGILYLYCPHFDMEYWRKENNAKHKWDLSEGWVTQFMNYAGFKVLFCSGRDMYYSFSVVGVKE